MNIFIHLKLNQNLKMNLILKKDNYQEKVLLKNVLVKLIMNIIQLNNQKLILILMNYKLDNKLNK